MTLTDEPTTTVTAPGPPVLEVTHLVQSFPVSGGTVHAVDDVSFSIGAGESLALVGESGCGKSTLARSIMRLPKPTGGSVRLRGEDLATSGARGLRRALRHMQMIFQDPISSLNPRRRVRDIIAEGLRIHRTPRERVAPRVEQIMTEVGLDVTTMADRRPGDFSGGQCQRIAIARAMAMEPELLICDEPVSALDVSVQAQVLNLLEDLQADLGLSYLFISHDLSVIEHICDRVLVLDRGVVVEEGTARELFENPQDPYTRALLAAVPVVRPWLEQTP